MDNYNNVVNSRLTTHNCNGGELHASLIWNDIADLDIHVITPNNEHMYYGHKESNCGGWLDVDMNAGGRYSLEPIENIFWASSPSGYYKIYVNNFNNRTDDKTVFVDPKRKVPFRVRLIKNGETTWFNGEVGPNENVTCFEFNHTGSGAIGSYITMPPSEHPMTINELCNLNNVTYTKGMGYYCLNKTEKVSKDKNMILHNLSNDTFIIGNNECKTILGFEQNVNITIKKSDVPDIYNLYIQSTSHNRKIPAGMNTMMKVSVKEALMRRRSDTYSFNLNADQ